jgi:hypothetical protein
MDSFSSLAAPIVVTVYVRHSPGCKYSGDDYAKRCDCIKWFRWWDLDRSRKRESARTRSWTEAELRKRDLEDQLNGKGVYLSLQLDRVAFAPLSRPS